jgi:hypothetical protein
VRLLGSKPPSAGGTAGRPEADRPNVREADRPYYVVKTHHDVAEVVERVLDPDREDLVVVLTARQDQREPSLDVEDVRAIVGPSAWIYFLLTGRLTLDLGIRMPDRRGPYNGSMRVWLPGASVKGHPREHPQVFDPTGEYGPRSLRQLAYGLRDAYLMRSIEPQVDPVAAHRSLELVRVTEEAEMTKRGYEEQLTLAHKELDEAVKGEREAERRLRMTQRDRGATQVSTQDPEGALMELILQRWLETLSLQERTQHPLGPYVLGQDFVRSIEGLSNLVRERLAYVCAMIVCKRAETLAALVQSPLPPNPHAHHDNASLNGNQAWQCSLTRQDSQSPQAVRYLQLADGTIKFTGMGIYKTPTPPGR